jgi:hypothetical protein
LLNSTFLFTETLNLLVNVENLMVWSDDNVYLYSLVVIFASCPEPLEPT